MSLKYQILSPKEIDKEKWNNCVINSENGLIYSRYNFLENICDNWSGLIINNYEAVMALPWRKKIGFRYLYEPPFTQQLGLIGSFSNANQAIFSFAKYGDVVYNFGNTKLANETNAVERTNLILDLSKGYDNISANYKRDLQLNLRKARQENFTVSKEEVIEFAIDQFYATYQNRLPHVTSGNFRRFKNLCASLASKEMCFTRKITNQADELLSVGLFLKDEKRIYNVMNTTTDTGRKAESNPFLLDSVIREFAGEQLIFDFEGSDLPGVKNFYEKFGAINQPYFHLHFNKLPFPFRLLKR